MKITIYHNPGCSKSRQTLALLQQRGFEPEQIDYLKTPPDMDTLKTLIRLLGLGSARALMRQHEDAYQSANLDRADISEEELLSALMTHPRLMQRPIVVVDGTRAVIGRPPENVLEIV